MKELNRPEYRPLPIIQGMSEDIYKQTPTPLHEKEARQLILEFQAIVTDIYYQLSIRDKTEEGYKEWRKDALKVQRLKTQQLTLLKTWCNVYLNGDVEKNKKVNENLQEEFDNDEVSAKQIKRELKWLRDSVGKLYNAFLEGDMPEAKRKQLKEIADSLNYRDR